MITKEKAKELSVILDAYSGGKTIQLQMDDGRWVDITDFSVDHIEYSENGLTKLRVKPELRSVPFTYEDRHLLIGRWLKSKSGNHSYTPTQVSNDGVVLTLYSGNMMFTYTELLNDYLFEDGGICGKYIEEL